MTFGSKPQNLRSESCISSQLSAELGRAQPVLVRLQMHAPGMDQGWMVMEQRSVDSKAPNVCPHVNVVRRFGSHSENVCQVILWKVRVLRL